MKSILCFGDSNTWGWNPEASNRASDNRFTSEKRWTGVLKSILGETFIVIEEGLCGRTTVLDDPLDEYRNGQEYLVPCLNSHFPVDFVVIMLGTNDLKTHYRMTASDIVCGIENLVEIVRSFAIDTRKPETQILVLSPPPIGHSFPEVGSSWEGAQHKCKQVVQHLQASSNKNAFELLNTHTIIHADELSIDGVHLPEVCHKKFGEAVAAKILQMNK